MEEVMGTCLDRGIRVISNAGGLDPAHCAEAVQEVADTLGLSPTIAYVDGDDLLPRLTELRAAGVGLVDFETGAKVEATDFISANAYLGCWGIVEALERGADIVVTGRTTDAALVCGPAAWHHGWARDDLDALAGAVVAGHVIECGTQATGGNYSFFTEVEGLERPGFPFAEIAADGSSVIGKHPGTGGAVTVGTVTAQLLYEIGDPAYAGPDVIARFDTIALRPDGTDRVGISGVRGEAPPETLKVSMTRWGGFRTDVAVALTGLDIEEKAELVERAFWHASPIARDELASVTSAVVRTDTEDPAVNERAVATWRLTAKDPDERKAAALGRALNELALASIPASSGSPEVASPVRSVSTGPRWWTATSCRNRSWCSGPRCVIDSDRPPDGPVVIPDTPVVPAVPGGPTRRGPLGLVAGARSGDKGGNANLGVFVRSAEAYAWLDALLSVDRLRQLLPEAAALPIDRFPLPNLWSINFVIHGILQDGVASSTRQDGQAKGLGEWLRARVVDIPVVVLDGG
ncbi:MAG: acyclic terpene utilization AtuA family protein [Acidimicrobiales bacterium]